MDYQETIAYLMDRLPMFSRKGSTALKPGLDNIRALCAALGNPQDHFPSIHVAGTNGKGSVSHLLAAAFQHNGYKTGLYTSPHLLDFRERFRINGQLIGKQKVVHFIEENKSLIERLQPSYFELSVALAFVVFATEKVDIAIIETGLGGRLDSTNIIHPELSVITQIGFDHTDVLGETLPLIGAEKAGIIKRRTPVVIGETHQETAPVFIETATQKDAPIYFADQIWEMQLKEKKSGFDFYSAILQSTKEVFSFKTDLQGAYQNANIRTTITATQVLKENGWRLPLHKVLESFSDVITRTGLHGRWETIHQHPKVILEVAHNPDGMAYLLNNLSHEKIDKGARLRVLLGFVKDKDIKRLLLKMPKNAVYYFTQAPIPRAMDAIRLSEMAAGAGLFGSAFPEMKEAVAAVWQDMQTTDLLLVTGSFFIVGEAATELTRFFSK